MNYWEWKGTQIESKLMTENKKLKKENKELKCKTEEAFFDELTTYQKTLAMSLDNAVENEAEMRRRLQKCDERLVEALNEIKELRAVIKIMKNFSKCWKPV